MSAEAQLKKDLMYIASRLPVVLEAKVERDILTKEEAIEQFPETDPKKFAYIQKGPNMGKVVATMPVQVACNHYRRMRRIFKKQGQPGVIQYIQKIKQLEKEQEN